MDDTSKPKLSEPVMVAEWWKNRGGESVRVQLSTFKEHNLVDIRTWFTADDGVMRPGKGFACGVRHLPRLIDALTAALDKARVLGVLDAEQSHG